MGDPAGFLAARLAETAAAAEAEKAWMRFEARPGDWTRLMCDPVMGPFGGHTAVRNIATGLYVGKMSDPARVLRQAEALRVAMTRCEVALEHPEDPRGKFARRVLADLAGVFGDHPDYARAVAP